MFCIWALKPLVFLPLYLSIYNIIITQYFALFVLKSFAIYDIISNDYKYILELFTLIYYKRLDFLQKTVNGGEIMSKLLILGAGQYGLLAKEIAQSVGRFEEIAFLDDNNEKAIGKTNEVDSFKESFDCAFVAMGDRDVRQRLFAKLEAAGFEIPNIISPLSYISSSAILGKGIIVEPMAVIHTGCVIKNSCFICAGAVVNHNSVIESFSQINCNATVAARQVVPEKTVLHFNKVYLR